MEYRFHHSIANKYQIHVKELFLYGIKNNSSSESETHTDMDLLGYFCVWIPTFISSITYTNQLFDTHTYRIIHDLNQLSLILKFVFFTPELTKSSFDISIIRTLEQSL